MPEDQPNSLAPSGRRWPGAAGDVPERLRRRYYVDGRGGEGLGFYVDAKIERPAFRDHGGRLTAARTDPNVVRDLTAIAQHRGWTIIVARGEASFRREAWVEGRALGLEVRGYRPTERDLQEVERRLASRDRLEERSQDGAEQGRAPSDRSVQNARASMKVVEAVVRARITEPSKQEAMLKGARGRIASWLERGAEFNRVSPKRRSERQRSR
jgi:hypothetical protein